MNDVWMLRILRWTYVAFIATVSLEAAHDGWQGLHGGTHDPAVILLAIPEALAALALLIEVRAMEIAACAVLFIVYAIAAVISFHTSDIAPLRFAYYAATAALVVFLRRPAASR